MTSAQKALLVEATARALSWTAETEAQRSVYRSRAERIVDELDRSSNTGNTIQLRRALESVTDRKEAKV